LKSFKKNSWGFEKTRKYTNVFNRPLLGSIIKPKTGLNDNQLLDMTKQLIDGGVNFIKEDEILANPNYLTIEKRVEIISNYIAKSNSKVIFCHCINGDHHQILNRAKLVHDLGGNGIHINFWSGFGVYNAINQIGLPLFIHFQKSGDKVITGKNNPYGIEWKVICKIAKRND
jgi:ribulose 1,5-bisphosphate carboxylase large subunit-like protein